MPKTQANQKCNRLIDALSARSRQAILKRSEPVELIFGTVLCEPDEPIEFAYFPLDCLISLMATTADHKPLGVAIIGDEGAVGATLALGVGSARQQVRVLGAGSCLRLTVRQLRRVLSESPATVEIFNRYSFVVMGQLSRTAACNSFHGVELRLARWLLMIDDRTSAGPFPLTHQDLADLLGVQRSAVTIAAGKLQRKKLISYVRGKVSIVSRKDLQRASCDCYELHVRDFARQFPT